VACLNGNAAPEVGARVASPNGNTDAEVGARVASLNGSSDQDLLWTPLWQRQAASGARTLGGTVRTTLRRLESHDVMAKTCFALLSACKCAHAHPEMMGPIGTRRKVDMFRGFQH
jgi:hypothetical protein